MTKSNKIMKRYIKTSLFAMTAVLALLSCSNDILLRESGKPADDTDAGPRVTFTVGDGKATTRTAVVTNYAGFAREKAIDVAHSYAVVFRPDGTHYGTFALSYDETDPGNPYYHFTLGNGGYYYMYVVANTSLTLTSETITDAASLFSLIDTTDPGADKQASTNFLMISPKTLVDVDGNQDTSLGAVTLTRAAVRYDIDATAIDGFQITSVQISNRYTTSMLARGSGNATTMTGLTKAASAETYTRGTESGQIPASGDYVEGTSTYYVDNQQWLGVIYGCENYSEDNADITEITINGTLLGVQVSHTVSFKDASTAVVTKPKRNTVYTVTLQAEGSGLGKGAISSNILVKDWDGTETIVYGDLNDTSKPSFQVTSAHSATRYTALDADASTKTNPGSIIVQKSTATDITLTVKGKNIGSTLTCQGRYDNASGNTVTATGVTITPGAVTNDGTGNIQQTWTISLTNAALTNGSDYLTFLLANKYDLTNAYRNFTVVADMKKMNPLYYVGEYNLNLATDNTTFSLNTTEGVSQGTLFQWSSSYGSNHGIMGTKWAASTSSYDGWQLPASTDRTLNGESWHLPTRQEYMSIVPVLYTSSDQENMFANTAAFVTSGLYTEPACVFGYNDATQTATAYQSYWSSYSTTDVRYAIRFLGTDYCSVWKYQFGSSKLVITSKLIDRIAADDATALSDKLTEIMAPGYNWTTLDPDQGELTRTFYACGYGNQAYMQNASGSSSSGTGGYYWSATNDGSYARYLYFCSGHLSVYPNNPAHGFSVRLFRDE